MHIGHRCNDLGQGPEHAKERAEVGPSFFPVR